VFWTTAQIAEATGLSQRHVWHLLRKETIRGQKVGHTWIVEDDEAKRFIAEYNANKAPAQQDA